MKKFLRFLLGVLLTACAVCVPLLWGVDLLTMFIAIVSFCGAYLAFLPFAPAE